MDLAILKHILRLGGIKNLAVRFDDPNRQIIATFTQGGVNHTELISFTEFESIFTGGPDQVPVQPGAEDRPGPAAAHDPDPAARHQARLLRSSLPLGAGTEATSGRPVEEPQPAGTK
jgi:hypothetical protein